MALAELMNRRPALVEAGAGAGSTDNAHIDKVAQAVCRLLGVQAQPRLARRLRDWPQLSEEAEDICQLAAIAFMEAYRQGRIAPDSQAGEHTARSVAAYAWGICNRIFAGAVRSSKPMPAELDTGDGALATIDARKPLADSVLDALEELLDGGPGDDESRLWEVLSSAAGRCRPEDIIMTYLLSSGVSVGEVRHLLGLSTNTPANAVRRVGRELRSLLGISNATVPGCDVSAGRDACATREDAGGDACATGSDRDGASVLPGDTP